MLMTTIIKDLPAYSNLGATLVRSNQRNASVPSEGTAQTKRKKKARGVSYREGPVPLLFKGGGARVTLETIA